jgi:hypothetical protein
MMSGNERIMRVLGGDVPDRVPFVPNIWQWFYANQARGTLPNELQQAREPVAALRMIGADVLSKFDGIALAVKLDACKLTVSFEDDGGTKPSWTSFTSFEGGNVRHETIETPRGTLTRTWRFQPGADAPFESEHWWKDFDREYAAVRAWTEDVSWELDREALRRGLANVGDDGIVLFQLPPTPLKRFHWLAGPEKASLYLIDHPAEMCELARIHEERTLAAVEQIADAEEVWAFEWPENLDSQFYSPPFFRKYCLPVIRKSAQIIHARGKYLFAHACGRLKALGPMMLEAGLDCIEGQAHPPIGDWRLAEARALSDRLILCGGMTANEQEWTGSDARDRIDGFVSDLFASLGDRRRFLFGSGCNTSPRTPYENLIAFRDAAWKYGRFT